MSKRITFSAVLSLAGVYCLPQLLNLKGNTLAMTNSWFLVSVCAVLWFGFDKALKETDWKDKRGLTAAGLFAVLFSVCLAFGVQLELAENVNFKSGILYVTIAVWTLILTVLVHSFWVFLSVWGDKQVYRKNTQNKEKSILQKWNALSAGKQTVLTACFFFLCWLPVFLAVYPGFFVYDAQDEFVQAATRNFTTHHPLPHVLLLGGIILAANKLTGSYNAGIAVYTLFQMLMMAGVCTYVIYFMKKRGVSLYLRIAAALYFAFFPVIVMFTLCSAKDGIFTAALLLLLCAMADLAKEKKEFFPELKKPVFFVISALIMMLFRHNGMYAFLIMVPVLFCYLKGCRKKFLCMAAVIFVFYFMVTSGLTLLFSAEKAGSQEMLTVPIQQLARTYQYEKDSFTDKEKETLYEIIPEEALRYYTAKVSDGVKVWFDNEAFHENPGKYISFWVKKGLEHPFTYMNAWLMTSYGFWYPDTVIDVYRGNGVFTFTYEDSSFFGYEVEKPGIRESKIPFLNEWYRKMSLEISQQKIPVISMLFSPGFLFLLFAFSFGYTYYRKRYDLLMPFIMVLLVWLTVILGPTYLPRYVLILWFALPLVAAVLVNRE